MSARFFVQGTHERGESVRIDSSDAHHIRDVLRLRSGDRIEVIDSAARSFEAEMSYEGDDVIARLVAERETREPTLRVDVAQGLPKGAKMDYVVEKVTELGAEAILPFTSERTIVRAGAKEKLARWRRIARTAAQQSGRRTVPRVAEPVPFSELFGHAREYDRVLFAWENADGPPLRASLPTVLRGARRVLVVVGPEGGFSHAEAAAAQALGATVVSLGRRILRTETAALALLAVIAYESEEERNSERLRRSKTD